VAKHGKHDRFKKQKKYSIMIEGIKDKNIAYIDDEYNKGWEGILRTLVESNGAKFTCFKEFDKKMSREELLEKIYKFLEQHSEIDCFILDLRLHEDDFSSSKDLTGHFVSRKIKELNKGNQIIVFTASNKIWNLKEEIDKIGASAYILKESPDLKLNREKSKELYIEFIHSLKTACSVSYLKDLVCKQEELCKICPTAKLLDNVVNLLILDNATKNQDLLSAALLTLVVFVEDFIENQLRYKLFEKQYNELSVDNVSLDKINIAEEVCEHIIGSIFDHIDSLNIIQVLRQDTSVIGSLDGPSPLTLIYSFPYLPSLQLDIFYSNILP
jgi:CheY-like chemotaxis protein